MTFFIWLLTAALVVNCLFLILLVIVQLPKKEAGAGIAFGGGAADALFGAGSGNALTSVTKWATGIFFALVIVLSVLNSRLRHSSNELNVIMDPARKAAAAAPAAPAPAEAAAAIPAAGSNNLIAFPATAVPATTNK